MKKFFVIIFCFFPFLSLLAEDNNNIQNNNPIIKFFRMGESIMTTIAPTNALGREINDLYAFLTWIGVIIFVVVMLIFIFIIIRFKENSKHQLTPSSIETVKKSSKQMGKPEKLKLFLEITWIVIPTIVIIIIAIPTVQLIFKIEDFPNFKDKKQIVYEFKDAEETVQIYNKYLKVNVIGHQWWWEFEYLGIYELINGEEKFTPMPKTAANEARFPVNIPILFQVNSEDVIHSFWVPRLGGKIDANPGASNYISFVFEEKGYFFGHCVEYCGASHALMRLNLVGVSYDDFLVWMKWGEGEIITKNASAQRGKELMTTCLACHTMNGLRDFQPREKKYEDALLEFFQQKKEYDIAIKHWKKTPAVELDGHFDIYNYKPKPPIRPKYYQGYLKTVAPDLTDMALKRRIISGIQKNSKENLVKWIQNPPKIKPEIRQTVVTRMPAYENIYSKEEIEDIVEFLLTVEYSESPSQEELKINK